MTKVIRLNPDDSLWSLTADFAQSCSWIAGKHFAEMLRENRFSDWEAAFAAVEEGKVVGFCTFLKTDYYPENRYWPWISTIFVDEKARGRRVSHRMIEAAEEYARSQGFARVYIPSDMSGFYEKCGYEAIDELVNYGGDADTVFMKKIGRLSLHVPSFGELWYRKQMLEDSATMSYNAGYELGVDGYHPDTGCIYFPEDKWAGWYGRFIGLEPERFYAYLVREEDGTFVGEVVLRQDSAPGRYEMGVVIEDRHRKKGYSAEAMRLLMDVAFERLNAQVVCNGFERSRSAALKLHLNAGFEIVREDDCVHLELTREHYLKRFG